MDGPEPRSTGRPVPRWPLRAWQRPPSIEDGRLVAANSVRVYLPFAGLGSRLAATASNRRMNGSIALDYARKRIGVKLLALHFSGLGLTGLVQASGERRRTGKCHVWLEHRGVIFDITADQFGKSYRPVIVTRRSRWHEAWKPRHEPITEQLLSLWREADPGVYDVYRAYRAILARLSGIADGASP